MSTTLDEAALDDLLRGSQLGVLTAASTFTGALESWVVDCVRREGPVTLLSPDEAATRFGPDEHACCVGMVGSLASVYEMPPRGDEPATAIEELARMVNHPISCLTALNAAGINALMCVAAAALLRVPLIDCDGQGRVFPLIDQTTFALAGLDPAPLVGVGPWGDIVSIRSPARRAERLERFSLAGAGGWLITALYSAPVRDLVPAGIPGTISRCVTTGSILRTGRGSLGTLLAQELGGRIIGRGTVSEIAEHADRGATTEQPAVPVSIWIDRLAQADSHLLIEVRNEAVLALVDGTVAATTPDTICLVDPLRRRAVDLLDLSAGDVVDVLVLPADERWHSEQGLAMTGPGAFGIPLRHHRST